MRKWAVGVLMLSAAVLFYIACAESPTSPPGSATYGPSGGTFGPSGGDHGPGNDDFGPCHDDFGPGSGTPGGNCGVGGQPTPTSTTTPGTPGPTPTGGPTPTATVVPPPPCTTTTATFTATDTPVTASGGQNLTSFITVSDPTLFNCKVTDVQITYHLTGQLDAPQTFFANYLTATQVPIAAEIFNLSPPNQLSGNELGSGCGTLFFASNGIPFPPATPPYVGVFRPTQPFNVVFGGVPGGLFVTGTWEIDFFYDAATMTLQCWSITFTLTP